MTPTTTARAPPGSNGPGTHPHSRKAPDMGKQHHDIGHQKRLRQKRERQLRSELRHSSEYRSLRPRRARDEGDR